MDPIKITVWGKAPGLSPFEQIAYTQIFEELGSLKRKLLKKAYARDFLPIEEQSPFDGKVDRQRATALNKLANANQDCLGLLKAIGVTVDELSTILDPGEGVKFTNGVGSQDNLWAAMGAEVNGTANTATVGDVFLMGNPPWPSQVSVDGLSAPKTKLNPTGMIYFRLSAITWENIIHEAAHQTGKSDWSMKLGLAAIYGADVVNINGPSSQISDKIKEKCK